jgi:hypothetical protein
MKKNPRFFKDKQLYPRSGPRLQPYIQEQALIQKFNKQCAQIKTVIDEEKP